MLENEQKQEELLDTTDSLEAIGVFKAMKNFLFVVSIICLLLLQVIFWLTDRNYVKHDTAGEITRSVQAVPAEPAAQAPAEPIAQKDKITATAEKAARNLKAQTAAEPQEQKESVQGETEAGTGFRIRFSTLAWLIRFCDVVLILSAVLYSLTILFSLKISLVGRLGGINHISRAFFLSLFMLVFLLPWQRLFGGIIAGAIYTPADLLAAGPGSTEQTPVVWATIYYLRFIALPLIVLMLLVFAQVCTVRWAKATLRRLEVI